jgi:hypothetical protein
MRGGGGEWGRGRGENLPLSMGEKFWVGEPVQAVEAVEAEGTE